MPLKKPARPKGGRDSETVRSRKPTEFTGMVAAGAIVLVVLGGVAAAMLTPRDAGPGSYTAGAQVREASVADATAATKPAESTPAHAKPAVAAPHTASPKPAEEPKAETGSGQLVTIAGCLEHYSAGFRLTDATGDVVPASRSWRTGFMKKRAAKIDVIDPSNPVRLANHVDERVSVTGALMEQRRMEVRSLRRISPTCADD
jgi:hypothetical protein